MWFQLVCALALGLDGTHQDAPVALLTGAGIELLEAGTRRPVKGSEGAQTFAWDHGGAHLLVTRGGALLRLSLVDGESEVLADGWSTVRMPDVAPDGQLVVFSATSAGDTSSGWQVVLLERASGETRVLSDGYDPCFSRAGDAVYFERYPGPDIWRVALAGGDPERVLEDESRRFTVVADPFTPRLAFSSDGGLVLCSIGTNESVRFSPDGAYDRFPSFAPDRRHVLFFREHVPARGGDFRGIRERDLVTGEERTLALADVHMAAYAPPTAARYLAQSAAARAGRAPLDWLPIDPQKDPRLSRWLTREATDNDDAHLFLPDVRELAPIEAAALCAHGSRALFLPALEALDFATATQLAQYPGSLYLDRLTELDVATARALATWRGNGEQLFLSLNGLTSPSLPVLEALGRCTGWGLSLEGLVSLSAREAEALGPIAVATLDLDGVTDVPIATATVIATWGAKFLCLAGWRDRDPECVRRVEAGCAHLFAEGR